jgi:beta-lactamase class D
VALAGAIPFGDSPAVAATQNVTEHPEWKAFFDAAHLTGTTVIYSLKTDRVHVWNLDRASRRFAPASTFKIANSLIGLETGVVADDRQIFPWDGVKRDIEPWNRDHTLRSAIKASAVPVYQEIARHVGHERMEDYVRRFAYGNKDVSGPNHSFWLGSTLQISAHDQNDFLRRLVAFQLPVSERSIRIVREILIHEAAPEYVLRAKTGVVGKDPGVGWWVGWVERDEDTWFFATNLETSEPNPHRISITRQALKSLGALP